MSFASAYLNNYIYNYFEKFTIFYNQYKTDSLFRYVELIRFITYNNIITDVLHASILKNFKLKQNYPNPFSPTTKIEFQIPNNSFVDLIIFNSLGQKVAVLVHRELEVGTHIVNFSALNLPSGLYLYKIQAGKFSDVKKMMLLK